MKKEPIKGHTECPWCGSENRVIKEFVDGLRASGEISKDAFPNGAAAWEVTLLDPSKALSLIKIGPQTCPKIRILWDVCAECKQVYIIGIEFAEQLYQVQATPNGRPPM